MSRPRELFISAFFIAVGVAFYVYWIGVYADSFK